jgi:diguanylate cyclase (GGDEF)-like protein
MEIKESEKVLLLRYIADLHSYFTNNLYGPAKQKLQSYLPDDLEFVQTKLNHLLQVLGQPGNQNLADEEAPYLKLAIQYARRKIAEEQELLRARTNHAAILNNIDDMMIPIDNFMNRDWYLNVETFRLPALTNFLTLQEAYSALPQRTPPNSLFDEKFGILQAPNSFIPSLRHARMEAQLRNIEVAVLFIDIDDFKSFNTEFSETVVDRQILPVVMQTIEAHVYSYGTAFKFGGDEYVLLLPNMGEDMSRTFLYRLQDKLANLAIPKVERKITVSVGCCIISADSFLTDAEVLENSNRAMRHAKKWKDCIAGFSGTNFEEKDLYHLSRIGLLSAKV